LRSESLRRAAVVLLVGAFAGCAAPRFYDRQVLLLDEGSERQFRVSYADTGDCLWRSQRWPSRYEVDRGPYQIALTPLAHFTGEPGEFRLELRGEGRPHAVVSGAQAIESPLAEGLRRYRLRPPQPAGALQIEIRRDERRIGMEEVSFRAEQCRALMWR
jgi:hypothetical protein